jgi:hypothetical protein
MADADLLQRYVPFLRYDSLESFRADSAATLPEHVFDDGSNWSYANSLKRAGGSVIAAAKPKQGQKQLDLDFLGKRYKGGAEAKKTDYLDAAGRRYVEDARRLHAQARYADRVYGHVARDASGTLWLQYWFFYYYNDKNFLGIGLHEGDWEMIQLRLGASGTPNAATFAQHNTGEAFTWSELERRSSPDGEVPVVYVGRGSHASFASAGEHWPMFPVPPDYSDGKGELIRPKLEVISDSGWVLWPGRWGSSDSSPNGPAQKARWGAPAAYHAEMGAEATRTRARRRRAEPERAAPPAPPAPELSVQRVEDQAIVTYRFPERLRGGAARPERLVVSVDAPGDDLPPASHTFTVRKGTGVVAHPMRLEDERYVVRAVAYSDDGVQSKVVTAKLPRS